jgi:hypothetical protein
MEATEESVRAQLKGAAHEIGCGAFEQQPGTILANLNQCASRRPLLNTVLGRSTGFCGRRQIRDATQSASSGLVP